MTRMRSILVVLAAASVAAAIAGTASAASGGGATVPPPALIARTAPVIVPDAGVTITTDPSKATGHANLAPSPDVLCATCGGGGNVQGCAVATTGGSDGFGNSVHVYYHWCWLNGSVSSNYGWADEAACFAICNFQGWNYNFDFGYGHQAKATFRDVEAPLGIPLHYDSNASACVGVDGWGNAWAC